MAAKVLVPVRPTRIISGGQTGADQGGLLAARELGIPTGGTAPPGWLTETGPAKELLLSFGLIECSQAGYDSRTRANVLDADGTVIFGSHATGGTALTVRIAKEAGKHLFYVPFALPIDSEALDKTAADFRNWLGGFQIDILNVAGNRESQNPGLQEFAKGFLIAALRSS